MPIVIPDRPRLANASEKRVLALLQEQLADMACETEASYLLTMKALAALDRGGRADLPTSMAKAYASEAAVRVASRAIQVHGAYGVTREFPVERHFRNARMLTIPDGTTQINQLIVGRELTGIPAFMGAGGYRNRTGGRK